LNRRGALRKDRKKGDKNDVFSDAGRNLIACLIAHLMSDSRVPDDQKTVEGFVNAIESIPEDKMQAQLKTISRTSESQYARRLASIVMGTHHETFSGAYFNATASIGYLLDPEVARLLSTGMNPSEILEGNNSVYIQIPTADLMYADGIGRMIVDAIVNSAILADGDYAERMLLQCDEAWLLKNMRSLDVVLQQGRKYGMPIQLIYTSLNRARVIWGEEGLESWLEGVGWTGYAAVSSATGKKLSEELGTRGVIAQSEGTNQGRSSQSLGSGSWSRGTNHNTHEIKRNLINQDEFKDCRTDELFVIPRNGRPFRCGMAPYFRRDEMLAEIDESPFRKEKVA
jgi:type IV secretion system protein VirD4